MPFAFWHATLARSLTAPHSLRLRPHSTGTATGTAQHSAPPHTPAGKQAHPLPAGRAPPGARSDETAPGWLVGGRWCGRLWLGLVGWFGWVGWLGFLAGRLALWLWWWAFARARSLSLSLAPTATAPLTAAPAEASGTFNPLCKVLCILQSLYLCAIGPMLVFRLARDTPCTSNCSPKPLYSGIRATARPGAVAHFGGGVRDSIPLAWAIPGPFLAPRPRPGWRPRPLRSPQHRLEPATADRAPAATDGGRGGSGGTSPVRVGPCPLPLHSPLLRQSQLLGLPPLSDMLKFSG